MKMARSRFCQFFEREKCFLTSATSAVCYEGRSEAVSEPKLRLLVRLYCPLLIGQFVRVICHSFGYFVILGISFSGLQMVIYLLDIILYWNIQLLSTDLESHIKFNINQGDGSHRAISAVKILKQIIYKFIYIKNLLLNVSTIQIHIMSVAQLNIHVVVSCLHNILTE